MKTILESTLPPIPLPQKFKENQEEWVSKIFWKLTCGCLNVFFLRLSYNSASNVPSVFLASDTAISPVRQRPMKPTFGFLERGDSTDPQKVDWCGRQREHCSIFLWVKMLVLPSSWVAFLFFAFVSLLSDPSLIISLHCHSALLLNFVQIVFANFVALISLRF